MFKKLAAVAIALGLFATQALPAFACGALVAPNGSVRLARATTLVAWRSPGVPHHIHPVVYCERVVLDRAWQATRQG